MKKPWQPKFMADARANGKGWLALWPVVTTLVQKCPD
jgi:hypothetical protein